MIIEDLEAAAVATKEEIKELEAEASSAYVEYQSAQAALGQARQRLAVTEELFRQATISAARIAEPGVIATSEVIEAVRSVRQKSGNLRWRRYRSDHNVVQAIVGKWPSDFVNKVAGLGAGGALLRSPFPDILASELVELAAFRALRTRGAYAEAVADVLGNGVVRNRERRLFAITLLSKGAPDATA